MWEVTNEEIKRLNDVQLTSILLNLLHCEVRALNVPDLSVDGSLDIRVADGGEDASVTWEGLPNSSDYVTNDSFYQIKATSMGPAKCADELLTRDNLAIKPLIADLFERGGRYVLFCNQPGQDKMRVKKMREKLKEFDVKNWENAEIVILNPTRIAKWVSKHFGVIAAVREYIGSRLPNNIQTWDGWNGYRRSSIPFVTNDEVEKQKKVLQEVANTPGQILRVTGLPGLGKTRLALEAFRDKSFSSRIAYVDAGVESNQIIGLLQWMRGVRGILIVDNCNRNLHSQLVQEIEHVENRLSLITIDFNPDNVQVNQKHLKITPLANEVIRGMLESQFQNLRADDLTRIVEFAEGFPLMAVLLSEANLRQESNLTAFTDQQLTQKLLWESNLTDPEGLRAVEAAALFTRFYYDGSLNEEVSFIALNIAKCDANRFFGYLKNFEKRGVLQPIGAYVRVTPKPLAWRLAMDWWEKCSLDFGDEMSTLSWPKGLIVALCEQLSYLYDTPAAKTISEKLCGEGHPFAEAKNLNTDAGSRIFRSLAQVNPQAALDCLDKAFGQYSIQEISKIGPGRRYLIWALEDLCFWSETFEEASRLMLLFASGENETIGNNATGQFAQLWQAALPGTQTSLSLRAEILENFCKSQEPAVQTVLIKAISKGLEFSTWHRTMGVEQQGGRLGLHDYSPTVAEVHLYWLRLLSILTTTAWSTKALADSALKEVGRFLLAMVRYKMLDALEQTVDAITVKVGFWVEGLQKLNFAYKHEKDKLTDAEKTRVQRVIEKLRPISLRDRLLMYVTAAPYDDYETDEDGVVTGLSTRNIELMCEELAKTWPDWESELGSVLEGEQRQADAFGTILAEKLVDPEDVVTKTLSRLISIPDGAKNPSFLAGLLAALKKKHPSLVACTIESISNSESLVGFSLWIMARTGLEHDSVLLALSLLNQHKIIVQAFNNWSFGGVLKSLEAADVAQVANALVEHSAQGQEVSLNLLIMFSYQDENRWIQIRDEAYKVLTTRNLLGTIAASESRMEVHNWETFSRKLLKDSGAYKTNLILNLTDQIISVCGHENRDVYRVDRSAKAIAKELLAADYTMCWPQFGRTLCSPSFRVRNDIEIILCNSLEPDGGPGLMFTELPMTYLLDWCETVGTEAQKNIARHMPIIDNSTGNPKLYAFASIFLEKFGDNKDVMFELDKNVWSFSWIGSMSGPYEQRLQVIAPLTTHKHSEVRKWAKRITKGLQQQLEWSRKRDAEHNAGIFDGWTRD